MSRSAESPIPEHVANAARNDLPREVLSHAEGLVTQAKEILFRHGVALEDLKKPEVRDRIPAEDIRRLLEISAKNAAARRGEVDAGMRREIVKGLDARGSWADVSLQEALASLERSHGNGEKLIGWYLRAGLLEEAREYLVAFGSPDPLALGGTGPNEWKDAIDVAQWPEIFSSEPERALRLLESVASRSRVALYPSISDYGGAFARFLRMVPDAQFIKAISDHIGADDKRLLVTVRVAELEAERRGIMLPPGMFAAAKERGEELSIEDPDYRVGTLLAMARADASYQKSPVPYLDWALSVASRDKTDDVLSPSRLCAIAETSAMIADTAYVQKVIDEAAVTDDGEFDRQGHRLALIGAITGFASAGKFDEATAFIGKFVDAQGSNDRDFAAAVTRTMVAMFDRGEIERALALSRMDFEGAATEARLRKNTEREYVAALARRGEDALEILSTMRSQTTSGPFARHASNRALDVANAAIATIGYARDAKRRIVGLSVSSK